MSTGMGPSDVAEAPTPARKRLRERPIRERFAELARAYDAEERKWELLRPDMSEAYSDAAAMLRGVICEIAEWEA